MRSSGSYFPLLLMKKLGERKVLGSILEMLHFILITRSY